VAVAYDEAVLPDDENRIRSPQQHASAARPHAVPWVP